MIKALILILCGILNLSFLTGSQEIAPTPVKTQNEMSIPPLYFAGEKEYILPVGEVPEKFQAAVEKNLLGNIYLSDNCFFKIQYENISITLEKYDFDFHKSAVCVYQTDESDLSYGASSVIGTSDGGFLFALTSDTYQKPDHSWVNGKTKLVKCNAKGIVEWEYAPEGFYIGSIHLFEKNGDIYIFGDVETAETKRTGVFSPNDVFAMKLDGSGEKITLRTYGGRDYDNLWHCEKTDKGFMLHVYTQSSDGDFSSYLKGRANCVSVMINDDLAIESIKEASFSYPVTIGSVNGKKATYFENRLTVNDNTVKCDDGVPTAVIDYDGFYLVVSGHVVGRMEYQPLYISSIWQYHETVYSAYRDDGTLLWRRAVDSTPKVFLEYSKNQELQQAKKDGCVVFEDLHLTSGREAWLSFVEKTEKGEKAEIRIANFYSEGPQIDYIDLTFDGGVFTVLTVEKNIEKTETYRYLNHYTGKARDGADFSEYESFVLTDDKNVTYEALQKSLFSSHLKDYIRHCRVYLDLKR